MKDDGEKIKEIFNKMAWIDKNRWSSDENNLINFSLNDLTNSEKILVHFLCYISLRGTTFSQIWDKGGFVYSDIVRAYTKKRGRCKFVET